MTERSFEGRQFEVLVGIANSFVWRPAITADILYADLKYVLERNRLIDQSDMPKLKSVRSFLALYGIALLHKSHVMVSDTLNVELLAGCENKEGWLEVKMQVCFHELGKPMYMPVCLFLTQLSPAKYCTPDLLSARDNMDMRVWQAPIEVNREGQLAFL